MPLSILTANMTVPIKDIEAWVHRPASVRQAEAETRNGYVTRPMNSFMLYRSAYAERTKQWGLQNNHQVVSKLAGQSWPLEPESIKRQYEEYARIERDNHTAAHPSYKFSPSKIGPVARKKEREAALRGDVSDSDSDVSEDSDVESDAEFRPTRGAGRHRRGRTTSPSRRGRGNRDAPSAPMTPPARIAAFQSYHDASPNPAPGYGAPQAWMGADGNMYTASPDSRGHGQQQQDYSSYNFDTYQQQPVSFDQYQPALPQQQQYQLQPAASSYGYGADIGQSHDQHYLHQQLAQQQMHQQQQQQPYFEHDAAMPVGLPGMTQSQLQGQGLGLDMYAMGMSQRQSMYPELDQVPRHHHGLDAGANLGLSHQQHQIDPALFQLDMESQQQQHGQSSHSMGHIEEQQQPAWDEAFGASGSSWNNYG
jgi:hypothetical protein